MKKPKRLTRQDIDRIWMPCSLCQIGKWAKSHVLFSGSDQPRVLFIGEGPGRSEDIMGEAFIGRAGKLLRHMIREVDLRRSEVAYSNLVACRPCDSPHSGNRPPRIMEIENCQPRLRAVLQLLQPEALVLVGKLAWDHWKMVTDYDQDHKVKTLNIIHPAYLLRQGVSVKRLKAGENSQLYEQWRQRVAHFLERTL